MDPEKPELEGVHRGDRHHGQLPGGHRGDGALVRQGPAPARRRPVHRVRPDGHHQRHPVQAVRRSRTSWPRWTTRSCRTSRPTRRRRTRPTSYDPGNVYSVPWASGMTGIAYDPEKVTGADHQAGRPVEPGVQGQGRHVLRHPGARQLRHAGARHRPGQVHPGRLAEGGRQAQGAEGRRHRPQVLRPELHRRPRQRRGLDHPGLVGRRVPEERLRRHELPVRDPRGGRHDLDRQLRHPDHRGQPGRRDHGDGLLLQDRDRRDAGRVHRLRHAGAGRPGHHQAARGRGDRRGGQGVPGRGRRQPAGLPRRGRPTPSCTTTSTSRRRRSSRSSSPSSNRSSCPDRADARGRRDERSSHGCTAPGPAGALRPDPAGRAVAAPLLRRADGGDAVAVAAGGRRRQRLRADLALADLCGRHHQLPDPDRPVAVVRADHDVMQIVLAFPIAYWIAFKGGRQQVHLPVPAAAAVLRVVRAAHDLVEVHAHRRGHAARAAEGRGACCPPSSTSSAPRRR